MTTTEIFIAMAIHLLIPLTGLIYFIWLTQKMKRENVVNAPAFELFVVFATYGGLLLVALTTLFWQWSGMASIGTFYLILGAPITMGIIAYRQRKMKYVSRYHYSTYYASLSYFIIAPITFLLLFTPLMHHCLLL